MYPRLEIFDMCVLYWEQGSLLTRDPKQPKLSNKFPQYNIIGSKISESPVMFTCCNLYFNVSL